MDDSTQDPFGPLNELKKPMNIISAIRELQAAGQADASAEVQTLEEITGNDTGTVVVDEIIAPAPDVEVLDPSDSAFSGAGMTGGGREFGSLTVNHWIVGSGALKLGLSPNFSLFGSDISAANTTALSIFHTAQTYNSESMGAGDLLMGSNSASKPNWFWDESAGSISLRIQTTKRVELTAAGSLTINDTAGAAVMTFDAAAGANLTTKLILSGASSALAIGTTPPTSATVGTGLWVDRNGVYALLSNVQQATLTSAGLAAGAGEVIIDASGISINVPTSAADRNKIKFMSGSAKELTIEVIDNGSLANSSFQLDTDTTGANRSYNNQLSFGSLAKAGARAMVTLAARAGSLVATTINIKSDDSGTQSVIVVNDNGTNTDFQVEGDTDANMIFGDASTDQVGIGTAAPGSKLDVNGTLNAGATTLSSLAVNGGSAVDTLLADGTSWTPAVAGDGTAGAGTYTTRVGRYAAIGNLVFIELALVWTAHTGTGNMIITGLPYTSANNAINVPLAVQWSNITLPAVGDKVMAIVLVNSTQINIQSIAGGAAAALALDTAATLRLAGWYIRA